MKAAALAAVLAMAAPAAADPARATQIARALAAVRGLGAGRDALEKGIYDAARASCTTDAVACWSAAATTACTGASDAAGCAAAADVIAVNLRGASALVDEVTRMKLVRGSADYRVALAGELRKRYAHLAAELVMYGVTAGDEAEAIDGFCAARDRTIHACEAGDTACVPSLPWSRCVAALVWFVGTSP